MSKELILQFAKVFPFLSCFVSMEKKTYDRHDKYLQNIFEFGIYLPKNENYVSNLKSTSCDVGVTRRFLSRSQFLSSILHLVLLDWRYLNSADVKNLRKELAIAQVGFLDEYFALSRVHCPANIFTKVAHTLSWYPITCSTGGQIG